MLTLISYGSILIMYQGGTQKTNTNKEIKTMTTIKNLFTTNKIEELNNSIKAYEEEQVRYNKFLEENPNFEEQAESAYLQLKLMFM